MKVLWNSFIIAFAMFSKIPMPRADWTKDNMKYMFCFFPLIGAVIGLLDAAVWMLLTKGTVTTGFLAAVLVLVPVAVTGGIHVDGLLDTADALASWQERKRRLEILKDSHTGAFAVIGCCVYFLGLYGSYVQVLENAGWQALGVLCVGFVVSRCLSAVGVLTFPKAREDGTVAEFSRNSSDAASLRVVILWMAVAFGVMLWFSPVYGIAVFVTALVVFGYYHHMAMKQFGGTTGDISGWFVCVCELAMAFVTAILSGFVMA